MMLDFQAHLVWLTLEKQQSLAPLTRLHRALDVGCGTGLWTIDFGNFTGRFFNVLLIEAADAHPEAEVLGVDLAPVQPNL